MKALPSFLPSKDTPLACAAGEAELIKIQDTDSADTNIVLLEFKQLNCSRYFLRKRQHEKHSGDTLPEVCVQEKVEGFSPAEQRCVGIGKC